MEKELPLHSGPSLERDQPESGRSIPSIEQPQCGTYQSRWTKRATESAALTEFARAQLVGDLGSFRQTLQRGQDTERTEALFDESGSEEVEVCRDAGGLDRETAIDDMKDWRAENSRHKGQVAKGSKSGWLSTLSKVKLGANLEEVRSHAIEAFVASPHIPYCLFRCRRGGGGGTRRTHYLYAHPLKAALLLALATGGEIFKLVHASGILESF